MNFDTLLHIDYTRYKDQKYDIIYMITNYLL